MSSLWRKAYVGLDQVCILSYPPAATEAHRSGKCLGLSWQGLSSEARWWSPWRQPLTLSSTVQVALNQDHLTQPTSFQAHLGCFLWVFLMVSFFSLFCSCDSIWNEQSNRCHWIHPLGIFQTSNLQALFFLVLLAIYLASLLGNTRLVMAVGPAPPYSNALFPHQSELIGHLLRVHYWLGLHWTFCIHKANICLTFSHLPELDIYK